MTSRVEKTNWDKAWQEHWTRWNIAVPKFDFEAMRNRVVQELYQVFKGRDGTLKAVLERFVSLRGLPPEDEQLLISEDFFSIGFKECSLVRKLLTPADFQDWISTLQCLLWAVKDGVKLSNSSSPYLMDRRTPEANAIPADVCKAIKAAIDMSPGAPVSIHIKGNVGILYPRGAKLLDEKLVNENLTWLAPHEAAADHFEKALSFYLGEDTSQFRNLLDELRKALEELLRSILGNDRPLEKQGLKLLPWLSGKGVHQQTTNMFRDLLTRFCQYQNDAVKHGNSWSPSEVEFMIYLTGTFMRMLLELDRQPAEKVNNSGNRQ